MKTDSSCVLCVADINITEALEQCLAELALPEVFIQRVKQMSLEDTQGFLGLRPVTKLEESRAMLYRIYVPSVYEAGLINRIAEATDLKLGGRGCILVQHIDYNRSTPLIFDTEKLDKLCGRSEKTTHKDKDHALISCVVPRGMGDSLVEAVLELGICVPVVFYGTGRGLRDKLGLMRITVPIEKEIIWFIVPSSDAALLEKIIIPRAGLDVPGRGFMYTIYVHAPVVNLRVRHGKRVHAATMEQIIAALDEVRGSSDWRRFGSRKHDSAGKNRSASTRALFFIGEEDDVEIFRKTAMECGARGATLNQLEMRSYIAQTQDGAMESHSRSLCDILITRTVEEQIMKSITQTDLFDSGKHCVLKTLDVEMPSVIRR